MNRAAVSRAIPAIKACHTAATIYMTTHIIPTNFTMAHVLIHTLLTIAHIRIVMLAALTYYIIVKATNSTCHTRAICPVMVLLRATTIGAIWHKISLKARVINATTFTFILDKKYIYSVCIVVRQKNRQIQRV